ncbi:hypothetical protein ACXET9_06215 [Brachybacterium sp. DNPG3]
MIDQLMILAEAGAEGSHGIAPGYVGGGALLILLTLLGIIALTSGQHQRGEESSSESSDH